MESPFRDDREAAHMRAEQLAEENEQLRRELAEARKPKIPPAPRSPLRIPVGAVVGGVVALSVIGGAAAFLLRRASSDSVVRPANDGKEHVTAAWNAEHSPTTSTLRGVWTDGRDAYAVGEGGTVLYRTPSGSWSAQQSGTTADLNAVVSGTSIWAFGDRGTILRLALDTRAWVAEKSNTSESLYDAVIVGPYVVAVGSRGTVLVRSTDGLWADGEWSTVATPTHEDLHAITAAGTEGLYAVGNKGTILHGHFYSATPAIVSQHSGTPEDLLAIVSTASSELFAFGTHGAVIRSTLASAVPWASERSEAQSELLAATVVQARYELRSPGKSSTGTTNAVLGVGRHGVYLVDNLHAKNGFEVGVVAGQADLFAVGASGSEAFAVGANGTIVHGSFDGPLIDHR